LLPLKAPYTIALSNIKDSQMENLTEGLTLETLPKAFTHLTNEVSEIKRLLLEKSNEQTTETDRWFDLNELCIYHPDKPSKPTVYGWVNAGTIPVHKGGKKLRFLKSEIDNWLRQGRKKTLAETASEAEAYLKKMGGNNE
jgi:excisionase family DNA binding protein